MITSIEEELKGARTVGITGHVRPDGDCTGSTLALYNYISENMPEIQADVYLEDIEEHFNFLSGSDKIHHSADKDQEYDVFIVIDCGTIDRVADWVHGYINSASKTICIDHHVTNSAFASVNHVLPKISSSCEVLYELLDCSKISKATAECLYVGIIHDTGVFKYQATTGRTMEIAGVLMSKGIDYTSIIDDTFFRKSYVQNILLGKALIKSELLLDGRLIYSYLTKAELDQYGVSGKDMGGIIDQLRFTEGVEVAMFIYDLDKTTVKVSLRSVKSVDVNSISNVFGGGGHIRAAGFSTKEPVDEIVAKVALLTSEQL